MTTRSPTLMIYGATGYTGRLIVAEAVAQGLKPVVAGRDAAKLAAIAGPAGLPSRVFELPSAEDAAAALDGVAVLLNCAGPFSRTAETMVDACLQCGVHYLDITGEISVFESLVARGAEAETKGVMLLPGVGFDVVASDCLIAALAGRHPDGRALRLGIAGLSEMSRGTARTVMESINDIRMRRDGEIVRVPAGSRRHAFDFGEEPRAGVISPWGDVATAYRSTGIANIETYFQATAQIRLLTQMSRMFGWLLAGRLSQGLLNVLIDRAPAGPGDDARAGGYAILVAEIEGDDGRRVAARLTTPEPYTLTARTATAIAKRALDGEIKPGYQTPSLVYGPDFILGFDGVVRDMLND